MAKQIHVGETAIAIVTVYDQFNQPMPGFDFASNPPVWSFDQPSQVTLSPDPVPNQEDCVGVAPTDPGGAVIHVHVPGVQNPDAAEIIQVIPAIPVATNVLVTFQP